MARISESSAGGRNVLAYLDVLAWSELGTDYLKRSDDGYNVIVTGVDGRLELFNDYAEHPFIGGRKSKAINSKGLTSNASGRYQQMLRDWPHYRAQLRLPDFGPISQDKLAIQHIRECRALDDVKAGRIELALTKCRNIWASLPGAGYGQREHRMDDLLACYVAAGGVLA